LAGHTKTRTIIIANNNVEFESVALAA